jgi:hypothetical protein
MFSVLLNSAVIPSLMDNAEVQVEELTRLLDNTAADDLEFTMRGNINCIFVTWYNGGMKVKRDETKATKCFPLNDVACCL